MKSSKLGTQSLLLSLSVGSLLSPFACQCLIAAQQRQKALADQHRTEKVFSVGDEVLLSTKHLNIKHGEVRRKLLSPKFGLVHLKSCRLWVPSRTSEDVSRLAYPSCVSRVSS